MRGSYLLAEMLVIVLLITIVSSLTISVCGPALCSARESVAESLIDQLDQACRMYKADNAVYPPSHNGSRSMAAALSDERLCLKYLEFQDGMLLDGYVRNPIADVEILNYEQYRICGNSPACIGIRIWGRDCSGDPEGVNNWR